MKIKHIITGLASGGAETMLYRLLTRMDRERIDNEVICLTSGGPMEAKIKALGVSVKALGMSRGKLSPAKLVALIRYLYKEKPDVVQTWMYHADLVGGFAAKLSGCKYIVWNIRHSNLEHGVNKKHTLWTARVCGWLSGWIPTRIVCNSETSMAIHEAYGYAREKITVIPNGFDLESFRPMPSDRTAVRLELGIPENSPLVGLFARYDPQKDHENFMAAASVVSKRRPDVHFLLCGKGVDSENEVLSGLAEAAGLRMKIHMLGHREDIPRLTAALDIACSASCGEGFPNTIGEALASGVPCVVTDVGDSAVLVGDSGSAVPSRDPKGLAEALIRLLDKDPEVRRSMGLAARARVMEKYELGAIAERYLKLYSPALISPSRQGANRCAE